MQESEYSGKNEIVIEINEMEDSYSAQFASRKLAQKLRFDLLNQDLISTIVSELSTNIIRYAGKGKIVLKILYSDDRCGLQVNAIDHGPGIQNVEMAVLENFTTTKNSLGLGLASVKRIMDDFKIISSAEAGTHVSAIKWR